MKSRIETPCLLSVVISIAAGAVSLSSTAVAQDCTPPCFLSLGDLPGGAVSSTSYSLSKDGTTVVGTSESGNGTEAFRWRGASGMTPLGDLPGQDFYSFGKCASANGDVVTGESRGTPSVCTGTEAFRWTEATGMIALGDLPGGGYCSTTNRAITDDGSMIGGGSNDGSNHKAYNWTSAGGMVSAGISQPSSYFHFSGDGRFAAGWIDLGAGFRSALRHDRQNAIIQNLGDFTGGDVNAVGYETTPDGSLVVGYGSPASGFNAMYWTSATGMVNLGDFSGGASESLATATNQSGSIIVGYGTSATGLEAAVWRNKGAIERLNDVLVTRGVSIPAGWVLTHAYDITLVNSLVSICGNGTNPLGQPEAWIARFCPGATGDMNSDGFANGVDVQNFSEAFLSISADFSDICPGDFDNSGVIDEPDVGPFADALLTQ